MQHLEVSGAVRHIYVIRQLKVKSRFISSVAGGWKIGVQLPTGTDITLLSSVSTSTVGAHVTSLQCVLGTVSP